MFLAIDVLIRSAHTGILLPLLTAFHSGQQALFCLTRALVVLNMYSINELFALNRSTGTLRNVGYNHFFRLKNQRNKSDEIIMRVMAIG